MKNQTTPNWKNNSLLDLPGEVWKDIHKFKGIYKVSNLGRIKSITRYIETKKGKRLKNEKILKQFFINDRHCITRLFDESNMTTVSVNRLVAEVFELKGFSGENFVFNKDFDRTNNALNNLFASDNDERSNRTSNTKKITRKSKYRGVTITEKSKNPYYSFRICVNGKHICKAAKSELEAAKMYNDYVITHNLKRELNYIAGIDSRQNENK